MSIGGFLGDAIRNIKGALFAGGDIPDVQWTYGFRPSNDPGSAIYTEELTGLNLAAGIISSGVLSATAKFDASRVVLTALENRSASISAYLCIKY
jgi:hypothetical protein